MKTMLHALGRVSVLSLGVSLAATAPTPVFAQQANPAVRYNIDIPAQGLEQALKKLGDITKVELIYDGRKVAANVAQVTTRAVKGRYTARAALERMLRGTGYTVRTGSSGVLIIEGGPGSNRQGNIVESDPADVQNRGISEILVVGARTQNSDVRRTEDDAQPYQVFDKEEIQRSQATTLEDFFRTRLTTNTLAGSEAQRTSGTISNGAGTSRSSINLRGLGTNQTLILVDGRRLGDLSIQGNDLSVTGSGQPDINGIPLASIERIEVRSSTAGGIYGGNAIGGVINIILRRDYRGLELTANYQNTDDFAYPSARFDVAGGLALEGGRTNITFGGSISRAGVLQVGERDFSRRGFALGVANAPGIFNEKNQFNQFAFQPPIGRGANIRTNAAAGLTLKPAFGGGSLGTFFTTVPVGFAGTPAQLGAALRASAGTYNLDEPLGNSGAQRSLMTAPELQSFTVNVRREFADWLDIFADYSKFTNKGSAFASTLPPMNVFLQPSSPINPFNEAIDVTFDNQNLATPAFSKTDTNRATLGFNLRLPDRWAVGFDYTWNWSRSSTAFNRIPTDLAGRVCAQFGIAPANVGACAPPIGNPADTRPAVDILTNADFSAYALTAPTESTKFLTTQWTPTLRVSGPVIGLPAGPINFTGQLQRNIARTTRGFQYLSGFNNRNDTTPAFQTFTVLPPAKQSNDSAYGELNIPLFGARNATTLLRELSLQASLRHDRFVTTQSVISVASSPTSFNAAIGILGNSNQSIRNRTTNYTVAMRYSPVEDIAFRASYGTGFLQPTINQVVTNAPTTVNPNPFFGTRDPLRGNTLPTVAYQRTFGGVFEIRPEKSTSFSAGVILTPSFVPGFRFSADYSLTKKRDEITSPDIIELLSNPDLFPGRVVRAPLTPADIAAGFTGGVLQSVNGAAINLFRSRVSSYDFQSEYDFDVDNVGQVRLFAAATYQPELKRQLFATQPILNRAGFADGNLKWRGNDGVALTRGDFVFQYNAQYYGPYFVYGYNDAASLVATAIRLQGSPRVRSQVYHDLFVSYSVPATSGVFEGVRVSAGVQNIFDKSPPILATTFYSQGGYSGYGDPRLRRFSLTLRKAFGN